ncbi:hypothetical protein T07_5694 [Trichinella nelsoni]|uniref:Uncharacterized protein n=1 Tax=Trichinella nelsoni TaxID=6336 RepID=A0A0V0S6Z2_9BILA|nr:hypothetical protein T07_5694 [Trichinella nelsoni]
MTQRSGTAEEDPPPLVQRKNSLIPDCQKYYCMLLCSLLCWKDSRLLAIGCEVERSLALIVLRKTSVNAGLGHSKDVHKENQWSLPGTSHSAVFFDHFIKRVQISFALIIVKNGSKLGSIASPNMEKSCQLRRQRAL